MYMHEETQNYMIQLIQKTFQLNAFLDNCVYSLDYMGHSITQSALHERFAHLPPEWADKITELLSTQGVRVVRLGLDDEVTEYNTLYDVFKDILDNFIIYRESILNCIEVSDISHDLTVKVFLEEFFNSLNKWFKQVQIWENKANILSDAEFDIHFLDFFI